MDPPHVAILRQPEIRLALRNAWEDSHPGPDGGHEEGGFILLDEDESLSVVRWQRGDQHSILVPDHPDCTFRGYDITATFHTHPNTGEDHLQEPSETDRRAVRDDPDLKGESYVGEFVISQSTVYLIAPDGRVNEVGNTREVLDHGV